MADEPTRLNKRQLKKLVKEHRNILKKDPANLVSKLKLAAALKDLGKTEEAVDHYREVAMAYRSSGKSVQAISVCKGILELEPGDLGVRALLEDLTESRKLEHVPPELRLQEVDGQWVTGMGDGDTDQAAPTAPVERVEEEELRAAAAADSVPAERAEPVPSLAGYLKRKTVKARVPEEIAKKAQRGPKTDVSGKEAGEARPAPPPAPSAPEPTEEEKELEDLVIELEAEFDEPEPTPPREVPEDILRAASAEFDEERSTSLGKDSYPSMPSLDTVEERVGAPAEGSVEPAPKARTRDPAAAKKRAKAAVERLRSAAASHAKAREARRTQSRLEAQAVPPPVPAAADGPASDRTGEPDAASGPSGRLPRGGLKRTLTGLKPQKPAEPSSVEPPAAPRRGKQPRPASPSLADITAALKPDQKSDEDYEEISVLDPDEEATFAEMSKPPGSIRSEMAVATEAVSLSEIPIFKDLPSEAFEILTSRMIRRKEPAGKIVVREGDPGNAFFVIISGKVRVEKSSRKGPAIHLADLGPGSFFGEFALLSDRKRHATVTTVDASEILEISRKIMGELTKRYKDVAKILRRFYRRRLLSMLVNSAPFFKPVAPEERRMLMTRLRFRKFAEGDVIIREGTEGGGFYLILIGEVKVTAEVGGKVTELGRLAESMYFGEMSLLKKRPAVATVTAVRSTELVQLETSDFYRILGNYPQIWQEVNKEAKRRELANHAILSGESPGPRMPDGSVLL